jgi:chorismate mutase
LAGLRAFAVVLLMLGAWCAAASPLTDLKSAIAARLLLMDDVARYKWNHAQPIVDPEREAALLQRIAGEAVALGLPRDYARRVIAAGIDASRTLQLELVADWQRQQHPPFADVPDLTTVQRPAIDAATRRLLEALRVSLCALNSDSARAVLEPAPPSLAQHPAAWSLSCAALWPVPPDVCQD